MVKKEDPEDFDSALEYAMRFEGLLDEEASLDQTGYVNAINTPAPPTRCRRGGCSHPTMPRAQSNGMKKHIQLHHPDDYPRFLALEKEGRADGALMEQRSNAKTSAHPLELFSDDEDRTVDDPPRRHRRIILEESDTDEGGPAPVVRAVQARGSAIRSQSLESFSEGTAALDNGDYFVERVEAMRFSGRNVSWFVKWAGWPEEYSSWDPHAHLANAAEAVADYIRDLHEFFLPIVPSMQRN